MQRKELTADVTGTVWKLTASAGATVSADEPIIIVESMKMEIPVACEEDCVVVELLVAEGEAVQEGQVIAIVDV